MHDPSAVLGHEVVPMAKSLEAANVMMTLAGYDAEFLNCSEGLYKFPPLIRNLKHDPSAVLGHELALKPESSRLQT